MKTWTVISLSLVLGACANGSKATSEAPLPSQQTSNSLNQSEIFQKLSDKLRFDYASNDLTSLTIDQLNALAEEMRKAEDSYTKIRIAGFTDPTGRLRRHKELSQARADRVRDYLISRGVAPDKLEAIGSGTAISNTKASAKELAESRRVEIKIVE